MLSNQQHARASSAATSSSSSSSMPMTASTSFYNGSNGSSRQQSQQRSTSQPIPYHQPVSQGFFPSSCSSSSTNVGTNHDAASRFPAYLTVQSQNTSNKKKRDPQAPKRPQSSFLFYFAEKSLLCRSDPYRPQSSITDIAVDVCDNWKRLTDSERLKYTLLADLDKARFEHEQAQFSKMTDRNFVPCMTNDAHSAAAGGYKRRKKDPNAPKRPQSAYIFFMQDKSAEIRSQNAERKMQIAEVAQVVGDAWRSLPESEKAKYVTMANQDKARFDQERSQYVQAKTAAAVSCVPIQDRNGASHSQSQQPGYKRRKKDPQAPKRPQSAYLFFMQERSAILRKQNPERKMQIAEVAAVVGETWRSLSEDEKARYVTLSERDKERFEAEMANYRNSRHHGLQP